MFIKVFFIRAFNPEAEGRAMAIGSVSTEGPNCGHWPLFGPTTWKL